MLPKTKNNLANTYHSPFQKQSTNYFKPRGFYYILDRFISFIIGYRLSIIFSTTKFNIIRVNFTQILLKKQSRFIYYYFSLFYFSVLRYYPKNR